MADNFIKVEGHADLSRDLNSGAIINRNRSAYENAKKKAKEAQKARDVIRDTTRDINILKSEMHEIKSLLKQLVSNQ
jgi:hypothetical protein|tara:strand:+ start:270 stop:500 length:231 start_codon:yes stop_codon:yes gene_type:complete